MLNNLSLTSSFLFLSSFISVIVIPKILLTLLCRNTSSLESRDVRRAQLSLPQRRRLHGIAAKIRYLDLRSTDLSLQYLDRLPMEADAAAILLSTSWLLRRLYEM